MSSVSRRYAIVAGGVALVAALAACAQRGAGQPEPAIAVPGAPGLADVGATGPDPAVLDGWKDFPVAAKPRPIVLIVDPFLVQGFKTDDGKIAAMTGRFELATQLPATSPASTSVALPDGPADLKLITAAAAFEKVKATGTPANAAGSTPKPLKITKVELATAQFGTDRGALTLPAWVFHAPDALEPMAWPAVSPEAFWKLGQGTYGDLGGAKLAADGVSLTITLAAPPAPCQGDAPTVYEAVAVESATAVSVGVRLAPGSPEPGDCMRDMMLRMQEYQVKLAAPLGNRVLVGGEGRAVGVNLTK